MRVMLKVAYDGSNYSGWQAQPNAVTIEGCINDALLKLTGKKVEVIGASRTDAGVHALGNIAVFDYDGTIPADKIKLAVAPLLPPDIVILESSAVEDDFHPRRQNTRKTYEYTYDNADLPNPLLKRYSWHISRPLDIERMNEAAAFLVGEHDFASFCSVKTQAESTVRTIYSLEIFDMRNPLYGSDNEKNTVILKVTGNGFLYNMVRIIAGTLANVGTGLWLPVQVKEALMQKDRTKGGMTAPPQGLKLVNIEFE